jgi:hypothetical protein
MARSVDFTFPYKVETGTALCPGKPALVAELDCQAVLTVSGDDRVWMDLLMFDAEDGEFRELPSVREPDLYRRIEAFALTDPNTRARLDEAEAEERNAQWRERPRANGPAPVKEIA